MRRLAVVALAALSFGLPAPVPSVAAAPTAAAFDGDVYMGCFGCGLTSGSAVLTVTGMVGGMPANGLAYASFWAQQPTDSGCVVSGTAAGTVTGVVAGDFAWSRVGALAVFTLSGATTATGVATFSVTSPVGNPCGGSVTARVTGVVYGDSAPAPAPECSDGMDNDFDGDVDHPADAGCSDASDDTENSDAACPTPDPFCVRIDHGAPTFEYDVYQQEAVPAGATHRVAGWVDVYGFPIPVVGGTAHVPCVVLVADSDANPCGEAGGTFESRLLTLVDRTEQERTVANGPYVTTIRVCEAWLTATVLGVGVSGVPIRTVC